MLYASALCLALSVYYLPVTGAVLCKPQSFFRVDCNICKCSDSGKEYSCTDNKCPPVPYREKFDLEENEQGYRILKPKKPEQLYVFDDDNSFVVKNGNRKVRDRLQFPYPNEDIPASPDDDSVDNNIDDDDDFLGHHYVESDINEAREANDEDAVIDDNNYNSFSIWPFRKGTIN